MMKPSCDHTVQIVLEHAQQEAAAAYVFLHFLDVNDFMLRSASIHSPSNN